MVPQWPCPSEQNQFLSEHVVHLLHSFRDLLRRSLVDDRGSPMDQARAAFFAPFVIVSHNMAPSPIFNYGNQAALTLFGMSWDEFTTLPSRLSAPPQNRDERDQLLATVTRQGYSADYRGIRIAKTGQRFMIEDGIVWNVRDANLQPHGQAATFSRWTFIS